MSEITRNEILKHLPYSDPFLFVDRLISIDENKVKGEFLFSEDSFFYKGHFKDNPVTPGVILTECMAQIGVVCLGIFLLGNEKIDDLQIAMTSTKIDFYLPVFPNEKVTVTSKKIYFRFGKLKCAVEMYNESAQLVCRGEVSGMFKNRNE